jgi:uncharacterized membrane protein YeiH
VNPAVLAHLNTALDLLGVFVFAISGAMSGVKHRLDLFGVLVLSFVAATSGGILRDVVIGATPPQAIDNWRYIAVSVLAGVITFYRCPAQLRRPLLIFDAAGLGLFCVAGTTKALAYGLSPLAAVLLGMLTGIGGGVARDALMGEVPAVFRGEIYALAALAGSTVVVLGSRLGWPAINTMLAGALLCFGLRCIAIWRGWNLPIASGGEEGPSSSNSPGADLDCL